MTPVQTFEHLLKVDRNAARVLLSGMGVFAAAAIVMAYQIDFNTAAIIGAFIVAMGTVLLFISFIFNDGFLKRVIAWLVTLFLFLVLFTLFFSAAFAAQTWIKPVHCLVRFWEPCEKVGDEVAVRNAPDVPIKPIEDPPVPAVDRAGYKLFIQFAGFKREDVIRLAQTLGGVGWRVQGAGRGGERVPSAAAKAEVRYRSAADEKAATLLAGEISESGVKDDVVAKQVPAIRPGTLEVWIGL